MPCLYIKLGYMIITLATVVHSFSCPLPEEVNCTDKGILEVNCTYGIVKDDCDICWECAHGFRESCGGIWNTGGTCAKGLNCSNPAHSSSIHQRPGVCCRTVPPRYSPKSARQLCEQMLQPCSLEFVCTKQLGDECGGDGDLKGICGSYLKCSPKFTMFDELDKNSTCILNDTSLDS